MNKHMVAVVVPIYKQTMTEMEKISFKQLFKILDSYEIIIVAPENLELPKEIKQEKISREYFEETYFQSVASYSRLMLSIPFYERFLNYDYILIYQLDAFVFSDKLMDFCELGYDYIGAPWFSGIYDYTEWGRRVLYVGNGGFSLRRVKSCINVLRNNKELVNQCVDKNEDGFFALCNSKEFHVASKKVALSFSIETEVRDCFEANHRRLPFGCHAWERYDLQFWKKYIERFGYKIDEKKAREGAEDIKNRDEKIIIRRYAALLENDEIFYSIPKKIESLFGEKQDGPYYLWGAGRRGRWIKPVLSDAGVKIEGFIDSNQEKQDLLVDKVKVYGPKIIGENSRIIITIKNREGIEKSIKDMNLKYRKHYIFLEDILPKIN